MSSQLIPSVLSGSDLLFPNGKEKAELSSTDVRVAECAASALVVGDSHSRKRERLPSDEEGSALKRARSRSPSPAVSEVQEEDTYPPSQLLDDLRRAHSEQQQTIQDLVARVFNLEARVTELEGGRNLGLASFLLPPLPQLDPVSPAASGFTPGRQTPRTPPGSLLNTPVYDGDDVFGAELSPVTGRFSPDPDSESDD